MQPKLEKYIIKTIQEKIFVIECYMQRNHESKQ